MSVLDVKLRRELLGSLGRLLAIASIIAVGVACLVAMRSAYSNLTDAKRLYYAQCRMADFWIDMDKAPEAELERLLEIDGISEIRSRVQFPVTVDLPDVIEPLGGLAISMPDRRRAVLNDIVLQRGSYFTEERENQVIVNDAFARQHGLHPGDTIHLLLEDRLQELFVVGTAVSSEFVYLLGPGSFVPDPARFGVFYIKRSYADEVLDFGGAANQVVGLLSGDARLHSSEPLRDAERLLEPYGVFEAIPLEDQASNQYLANEIEGLGTFGTILPVLFLAIAALVLGVLMTRVTEQQRVIIGTLKALGYTNREVGRHFTRFGLAVGLVGGVAGCALGYWFADGMTSVYRQFFQFPQLPHRFYPGVYAAGIVVSLVCAVAGAWYGTRSVLRLQPAEAMRPKPPRQGGAILLERLRWLWQSLTFGWRMVLRSVIRNRVRTAVGVFAAAMGASLLVYSLSAVHATWYLVEFEFERLLRSDYDLAFTDERSYDAVRDARRLPGVDYAEPLLTVSCVFEHGPNRERGAITGLKQDARLTVPRDLDGNPIRVPSSGIAMTRMLADLLEVKPGDRVTVQPTRGRREPREVLVTSVTESFLGLSVYADIEFLSRLVNEELAVTGVQLETARDPQLQEAFYRELKELPALQGFSSRPHMIDNLEETVLQNMWVFIGVAIAFSGTVFFGSILNASLINLAERKREVATLRVLGYGPWEIGGLFLRESMLVNLIGTVLGLPLGYLLLELMAAAYQTELIRFPVVSPPIVWIVTLLLAVVFGLLAHVFVQRAIHHMNYVEALQMKE